MAPDESLSPADWEGLCARFIGAREELRGRFEGPDAAGASARDERSLCTAAVPFLQQLDANRLGVVDRALAHPVGRWFVAGVLRESSTFPELLFPRLVRAAIEVGDPSWNRAFIDPCVKAIGLRETTNAILGYLRTGSSEEKLSAAAALYWIPFRSLTFPPGAPGHSLEDATKESREVYASLRDVRQEVSLALLRAWVTNDDATFRRCLADMLYVPTPLERSDALEDALAEARRIAKAHPDEATRRILARKLA